MNDSKILYMIYDITMTVVWCFEVLDRRQRRVTDNAMFYAESWVAIYFLIGSSATLLAWNFKSENITLIFVDLVLNCAAYTYTLLTAGKSNASYGEADAADTNLLPINSPTENSPEQ